MDSEWRLQERRELQARARAFQDKVNKVKGQEEKKKRGPKPKPPVKKLGELRFVGRQKTSPNSYRKTFQSLNNLASKPLTRTTSVPRKVKLDAGQDKGQVKGQIYPSVINFDQPKHWELNPRRDSFILDIFELNQEIRSRKSSVTL